MYVVLPKLFYSSKFPELGQHLLMSSWLQGQQTTQPWVQYQTAWINTIRTIVTILHTAPRGASIPACTEKFFPRDPRWVPVSDWLASSQSGPVPDVPEKTLAHDVWRRNVVAVKMCWNLSTQAVQVVLEYAKISASTAVHVKLMTSCPSFLPRE